MTSFRSRIQYSALALILVLLLGLDVTVYWGFDHVLHQYVNSRLQAMAESWADIIGKDVRILVDITKDHERPLPSSEIVVAKEAQTELREAVVSIRLLSLDGEVLWKGAAVSAHPPVDMTVLRKVQEGSEVFDTVRMPDGTSLRRVWVPIRQHTDVRYVLQAETPLRLMERTRTGLAALLGVASGMIIILAWFGSNWLARKALIPVEALSATAQRISEPSSLATRLVLDAPYEEFRRLTHAFNTMMDRLQKVFEAQRRFVADAAHEIQTPLTVLKGNLEVAFRKDRKASEYRAVLIGNLREVERLIHLSRSLITLAKLAGNEATIRMKPLLLEPLLRHVVSELGMLAEDRNIKIDLELCSIPPLPGDEDQLNRLIINLLDNALRYTGSGGVIKVQLATEEHEVRIAVHDNGAGIPVEHLPHIFERFYRTDYARARDSGGSGLGLAIVKEIVDAHRGRIEVRSEVGKGSRFVIWLPMRLGKMSSPVIGRSTNKAETAA
jgi:heavy metal sensor kinase